MGQVEIHPTYFIFESYHRSQRFTRTFLDLPDNFSFLFRSIPKGIGTQEFLIPLSFYKKSPRICPTNSRRLFMLQSAGQTQNRHSLKSVLLFLIPARIIKKMILHLHLCLKGLVIPDITKDLSV